MLAATPIVPLFTQHRIAQRAPLVAYVPARIATGYRYYRWAYNGGVLRIWFRNRAAKELTFVVSRQRGTVCTAGKSKTFQLAGNKAYWAQSGDEQQSWRCVNGVRLTAATSMTTRQFADVGLGIIVASAHKIR